MKLASKRFVRGLAGNTLMLFALAFLDSSHFFPLTDHSDLRFQATGELIEILVLAGLFLLTAVFFEQDSSSGPPPPNLRLRIILAAFIVALLLTFFWRDFFPNDQFTLSAGLMDFLYAPLGGLGVLAIGYVAGPTRGKPMSKDPRPVG